MPRVPPRPVVQLLLTFATLPAIGAPAESAAVSAAAPAPSSAPQLTPADPATSTTADTSFPALAARIRRAAASPDNANLDHWKNGPLDAALATLISQVRQAAQNDALELPVELADMQDLTTEPRADDLIPGTLWVCRGGTVGMATRAIILADGSVEIAFANECVIIARGAVHISHGNNNVVVAGQFLQVAHDGHGRGGGGARPVPPPGFVRPGAAPPAAPPAPPPPDGSILISGGPIEVSHATGTVCSSPRLVAVSSATGVTFLNSPNVNAERTQGCQAVEADALALAPPEAPNPLEGKLKITQVVYNDRPERRFVLVDDHGTERVVRPGEDVRDGAGTPLKELAGWKLTFVGAGSAVFSDGARDATFHLGRN